MNGMLCAARAAVWACCLLLCAPSLANAEEGPEPLPDWWIEGDLMVREGSGAVIAGAVLGVAGAVALGAGANSAMQSSQSGVGQPSTFTPLIVGGAVTAGLIGPIVIQIGAWHTRSGVRVMGGRMPVTWGVFAALFTAVPGPNYAFSLGYFGASRRLYVKMRRQGPDWYDSDENDGAPRPLDEDDWDREEDEDDWEDEEAPWEEFSPDYGRAPLQLQIQPLLSPEYAGLNLSLSW